MVEKDLHFGGINWRREVLCLFAELLEAKLDETQLEVRTYVCFVRIPLPPTEKAAAGRLKTHSESIRETMDRIREAEVRRKS